MWRRSLTLDLLGRPVAAGSRVSAGPSRSSTSIGKLIPLIPSSPYSSLKTRLHGDGVPLSQDLLDPPLVPCRLATCLFDRLCPLPRALGLTFYPRCAVSAYDLRVVDRVPLPHRPQHAQQPASHRDRCVPLPTPREDALAPLLERVRLPVAQDGPRRLHQQRTQVPVTLLRDRAQPPLARGVLCRHQPDVALHLVGVAKTLGVVHHPPPRPRHPGAATGGGRQERDGGFPRAERLELALRLRDALFHARQQRDQRGDQMTDLFAEHCFLHPRPEFLHRALLQPLAAAARQRADPRPVLRARLHQHLRDAELQAQLLVETRAKYVTVIRAL